MTTLHSGWPQANYRNATNLTCTLFDFIFVIMAAIVADCSAAVYQLLSEPV